MKTAIFLKDNEIELLEKLLRDYENKHFRDWGVEEGQEILNLIETLSLKGVETK